MVDVQIDIVHAQVLQAAVDIVEHMLTAINALLDFLVRTRQKLCGYYHIVTSSHIPQGTANELLRRSQLIGYCRIKEVYAQIQRTTDNLACRFLANCPRMLSYRRITEAHAT